MNCHRGKVQFFKTWRKSIHYWPRKFETLLKTMWKTEIKKPFHSLALVTSNEVLFCTQKTSKCGKKKFLLVSFIVEKFIQHKTAATMSAATLREGFYPFPPYINGFSYTTPFFFIPTCLLAFVGVIGFCRYLHTKQVPWQDISSPLVSPDRRLSPLSKLIVYMCCLITMSYLLDTAVVVAQVFLQGDLSTILVYYIGVSWLAWAVSLLCLMDESHKFSKWYWLQYTFFALATMGEAIIGWLWTVGIYKPRPGNFFHIYLKRKFDTD